jgi:hypothetical protein
VLGRKGALWLVQERRSASQYQIQAIVAGIEAFGTQF